MPNYKYIKETVEKENRTSEAERRKIHDDSVKLYYEKEQEMVNFLSKKIKSNIERAVYRFYKGDRPSSIIKRGYFSRKYYYEEPYLHVNGSIVDCYSEAVSNGEDSLPCINFPDDACFDSFLKKLNETLAKEKIVVYGSKDNIFNFKRNFSVTAELGKL